jgi:hypothetical protein
MKRNIWPFGPGQPLGSRSTVRRRAVVKPIPPREQKRLDSERLSRKLEDKDLERKLRAHYAKGGTLHEFLAQNPGVSKNRFQKCVVGRGIKNPRSSCIPWNKPADKWASEKAAEMFAQGYSPRTIIEHLEAYGVGFQSAQALVRKLQGNPRRTKGEFAKCVKAVSSKGGAYDPRAVCASAGRKKYGAKKFQAMALAGKKRAKRGNPKPRMVKVLGYTVREGTKRHAILLEQKRQFDDLKRSETGRGRKNPAEAAAEVFEEFHGSPSTEIIEVKRKIHYHGHLAALGRLEKLVVEGTDGYQHTLVGFRGAQLCTNEAKDQMFIEGGDQELEPGEFHFNRWPHELNTLGVVTRIEYFTTKTHLGKQGGTAIYFHEPGKRERGESAGVGPDLIYDARNESLSFSGGTYEIRAEGIDR